MRIGWSEIYANTDILSPIDRDTWQVIARTCNLTSSSRVIELASGKGAFARFLAARYGCKVDGFDKDSEFVEYSKRKAAEENLLSLVDFHYQDVNTLSAKPRVYDLGVCLGALYIFREAGWRILTKAVKYGGYLAISDIFCKKLPAPTAVMDVYFEEENLPITLQDVRHWYAERGYRILREEECSWRAWLEYYDLIKEMLQAMSRKYASDNGLRKEITKELEEDRLIRKYGQEYVGYMTFIMQKAQ